MYAVLLLAIWQVSALRRSSLRTKDLPVVDESAEVKSAFEKLDLIATSFDKLEGTQYNETLNISLLEASLGAAGLEIGDFEQEAVPLEHTLYEMRHNLSIFSNDSVTAESNIVGMNATIVKGIDLIDVLRPQASSSGAAMEETLTHLREKLDEPQPLLARANEDRKLLTQAEEIGLNATREAVGSLDVRASFDRMRKGIRALGKNAYESGVPVGLLPNATLARLDAVNAEREEAAADADNSTEVSTDDGTAAPIDDSVLLKLDDDEEQVA